MYRIEESALNIKLKQFRLIGDIWVMSSPMVTRKKERSILINKTVALTTTPTCA